MSAEITVWTINHIADWEGGPAVFATREDAMKQVLADAEEFAADTGISLSPAMVDDLDLLTGFIEEYGWKVQRYDVEEHTLTLPEVSA